MERLTARDGENHAYFPACFEEPCNGMGCKKMGLCKLDEEVCQRLAAYEDTGLEPEDLQELKTVLSKISPLDLAHLRDLLRAEKDGRLVVLPCVGSGAELERDGYTFRADHWNHVLTAFRNAPETKSGKQMVLFNIKEAEAALVQQGGTHETDPV